VTDDRRWRDATVDLLERTRLSEPDALPAEVNAALRALEVDVTIYLIDYEQEALRPVPEAGRPLPQPLPVESTLAGRAFMAIEVMSGAARPGTNDPAVLWMPLLDGSERLGVLAIRADERALTSPDFRRHCDLFAALLGHLVATKDPYGDTLERTRRSQPMSVASELLWKVLPPLTYACERFVISALFAPRYEVGGDGFDYAVDDGTAFLCLLDTTGHGLAAGLGTAVALSTLRASRRAGAGLYAMARAVDHTFEEQFSDSRFTTAVLATLDFDTGLLRYINAGHPQPAVLRNGRVVRRLTGGRRMPLGLDDPQIEVAEELLQPGDRLLLFSDGVVEARDRTGAPFGEQRLLDLAERQAFAELPAPETLRRLGRAVAGHLDGPPADDATLMLVEWSAAAAHRSLP